MGIPSKTKIISLLFKITVAVAAAVGVILSAYAARDTFMGGNRVFMFFTIQSNIAIALIAVVGAALLFVKRPPLSGVWPVIVFVGTVSITLTGAVFCFILAPTLGEFAWNPQNVLTHVVVPVSAIADFFVCGVFYGIKKKSVIFVILPPGAYALYAGIGYAAGWEFAEGINYPYFFLNWGSPAGAFGFSRESPFMGCVWWILLMLLLLIGVGFGYLAILDGIKKRKNAAKEKH